MDSTTIATISVASVISIISLIFVILTYFRNKQSSAVTDKKESIKDVSALNAKMAESNAELKTDIIWIKNGIGELKTMIAGMTKDQTNFRIDLSKIEERVHHLEVTLNESANNNKIDKN